MSDTQHLHQNLHSHGVQCFITQCASSFLVIYMFVAKMMQKFC